MTTSKILLVTIAHWMKKWKEFTFLHTKRVRNKQKKKRASTISKKGGGSKKCWEGIFPSIIYTWQDLNDNELVTVEVHMPSGSISSKFHLELEQDHPNEPQVLVIKYRVGACFFNKDAFNSFIHDVVQNGRDACSMAQACHNKIIKMKKI